MRRTFTTPLIIGLGLVLLVTAFETAVEAKSIRTLRRRSRLSPSTTTIAQPPASSVLPSQSTPRPTPSPSPSSERRPFETSSPANPPVSTAQPSVGSRTPDLSAKSREVSATYAPGRVIVKLKPGVVSPTSRRIADYDWPMSLQQLNRELGAKPTPLFTEAQLPSPDPIRLRDIYLVTLPEQLDPLKVADQYKQKDRDVLYAQPDYRLQLARIPNDPYYSSIGSWKQTYGDLWGHHQVKTEQAWDVTRGRKLDNRPVVTAIIDTGVDYTHPDLAANIWTNPGDPSGDVPDQCDRVKFPDIALADDDCNGYTDDIRGWNFVNNTNDSMDTDGHGTHVAGIIGAAGNNNLGVVGLAHEGYLMIAKAFGGKAFSSQLAKAIVYAAHNGAEVANLSGGACPFSQCPSNPVVEEAVRTAYRLGTVLVLAAGNESSDIAYHSPQNMPEVITVAAIDVNDRITSFSNWGAIDVAAPGVDILSLQAKGTEFERKVAEGYAVASGTSVAAPYVAGAAALVKALHPEFSPEQVRQALRRGADDIETSGVDLWSGHGRLNVARALAQPSHLAVRLTSPRGGIFTNTFMNPAIPPVVVRGVVSGPDLAQWRLEYGIGRGPAAWTTLNLGFSAVTQEAGATEMPRLGELNLSQLPDGAISLRVVAQSRTGAVFEDRIVLEIGNVFLTEPRQNAVLRSSPGRPVMIKGTASPSDFKRYAIRLTQLVGLSADNQWETKEFYEPPNLVLMNDGKQRVRDDLLATWDTTSFPAGHYVLWLEVERPDNSKFYDLLRVIVDPTIHEGWPKPLALELDFTGPIVIRPTDLYDHLTVADVNRDKQTDLLIGYNQTVDIFDHTGASLPGWPQRIPSSVISQSPAVGDLDGDGQVEVVVPTRACQVFAWHADGTPLAGDWPTNQTVGGQHVVLADLDSDGRHEAILANRCVSPHQVIALDGSGKPLLGWPQRFRKSVSFSALNELSLAAGDVDGDGQTEVVVADANSASLFVFRADGTPKPGWPQPLPADTSDTRYVYLPSYPMLHDLDRDGNLEIVVSIGSGGLAYAFHHMGKPVNGWPFKNMFNLRLSDMDGTGGPELIWTDPTEGSGAKAEAYSLFAQRLDGTPLPGWPVQLRLEKKKTAGGGFGHVVVADVNGDGKVESVVESGGQSGLPYALHAYQVDGTEAKGFPKPTITFPLGWGAAFHPAVSDFDGDGLLELAWVDGKLNLYLWDLEAPATSPTPWPMFQHDPQHTGCADCDRKPTDDRTKPTVRLVSPSPRDRFIGRWAQLEAEASDDRGVTEVSFYRNGVLIGTGKASFIPSHFNLSDWNREGAVDGSRHTFQARAKDAAGNEGVSEELTVTLDLTPPKVRLVSPLPGAVVSGSVEVLIEAEDENGLSSVTWALQPVNGNLVTGTGLSSGKPYTWDTRKDPDGVYKMWAYASDAFFNDSQSEKIEVTIRNQVPPQQPDLAVSQFLVKPPARQGQQDWQFTAIEGEKLILGVYVVNQGRGDAPATPLLMYVGGRVTEQLTVPALRAGEGRLIETQRPWTATPGTHTAVAHLNVDRKLAEADFNNNWRYLQLTVVPALQKAQPTTTRPSASRPTRKTLRRRSVR